VVQVGLEPVHDAHESTVDAQRRARARMRPMIFLWIGLAAVAVIAIVGIILGASELFERQLNPRGISSPHKH
jgi:hypothetical protein